MNRRKFITLSASACLPSVSHAGHKGDRIQELVDGFMKQFNVPGFSVAFGHRGKVVFSKAYGHADLDQRKELDASHLFRVASVSKPITAVAIFQLIEGGQLKLDDAVFNKGGILDYSGPEGITVKHLLNHTCGGWSNEGGLDPMFTHIKLSHDELIRWVLQHVKLTNRPGEKYAYSNFGYCLLGRIIEKVTSMSYSSYVGKHILDPCGIRNMQIGQSVPVEGEVNYYDQPNKPMTFAMNIARMDAHGGWIGTPTDLVQLAMHVDGFDNPKDILKRSSIETMTAYEGVNKGYACGWSVNQHNNYWHMGSLPGLTSILVRTQSGFCWSACANTRAKGMSLALDQLMWKLSRNLG